MIDEDDIIGQSSFHFLKRTQFRDTTIFYKQKSIFEILHRIIDTNLLGLVKEMEDGERCA